MIPPNLVLCLDFYHNIGWKSLWGSKVEPYDDLAEGYWVLRMPEPINIK